MAQLQVKKMKQGMSYSCKEKTIILNVFKYFSIQFPEKCVTDIVRRTAKATGCSEKSIFQFRKEEASAEGFREPSKTKIRKNININSRDIKYDSSVRHAIRNIVYNIKYRGMVASLSTILKHVNSDERLPNFSLMTLRRLLFDMGFYYVKNGNKSILTEKPIVNKDNVVRKVEPREELPNTQITNAPKVIQSVISQANSDVPSNNIYSFANHPPLERTNIPPFHHTANIIPPSHAPAYHSVPIVMNGSADLVPTHPAHAVGGNYIKMQFPGWLVKQDECL